MDNKRLRQNEEDEIDLLELFFVLLDHWKAIVLAALICGGVMFGASKMLITPMYQSTSQLYVLSKSTSITSLTDIQVGTSLANDYQEVITGRPVLEQVIENLGLDMTYRSLVGKVNVTNPSSTRILKITVTDPDPAVAKMITDEIAKVSSTFIAEKMDQDPPSIIQYGYADGQKVSPNTTKNTMMGILAGGIAVCAIFILMYLMNDTIMTTEDVETKLELHVLGIMPETEAETDGSGRRRRRHSDTEKKEA